VAARYIEFATADGESVLVESDITEVAPPTGVVKAGIGDKVKETIAVARESLDGAMRRAISSNAQAIIDAVQSIERTPTDVEICFGLKVTGEVGNIAVGKAGSDINYQVKLAWQQRP
jgi:Trypsin-co-occurring domain 1